MATFDARLQFLDAQEICLQLELGTAGRRDVLSLLMYIREHAAEGVIRDLADSVAHSDRDRGHAYTFTKEFVDRLVAFVTEGGILEVETLYDSDQVIQELSTECARQGVRLDASRVSEQKGSLLTALGDLLSGVSLHLGNPNITWCKFVRQVVDGTVVFGLKIKFTGLTTGATPIPDGTELIFPVLVSL